MKRECWICRGSGRVIDQRETRLTGFTVYADCTCVGTVSRGWQRMLERERRLKSDAVRRAEETGEIPWRGLD